MIFFGAQSFLTVPSGVFRLSVHIVGTHLGLARSAPAETKFPGPSDAQCETSKRTKLQELDGSASASVR